jgi:hemoglobin
MDTLYVRIGNENLQKLIDQFYDLVFSSEKIAPLFKNDKEEIKEKQYLFLSQFLGGPHLYTQKYGHPKMRARHLHHAISEEAKNEWLRCMKLAIATLDLTDDLKIALYNCFPAVAQHMVNQ